jgi:hypothetical protein
MRGDAMRRPRFTVLRLMIAVAVVALGLAEVGWFRALPGTEQAGTAAMEAAAILIGTLFFLALLFPPRRSDE